MARRSNSSTGCLITFGIAILIFGIFSNKWNLIAALVIFVGIIILIFYSKAKAKKDRISYLKSKYHDDEIVDNIYHGRFWQGQTTEQLLDSLGEPSQKDTSVLKTKKTEVWKYGRLSTNRFSLRIILENDVVVGWEKRHDTIKFKYY